MCVGACVFLVGVGLTRPELVRTLEVINDAEIHKDDSQGPDVGLTLARSGRRVCNPVMPVSAGQTRQIWALSRFLAASRSVHASIFFAMCPVYCLLRRPHRVSDLLHSAEG